MIINIVFSVLALVGAILVFGPKLLEMLLAFVASIDFISGADLIVFGIMILVLCAVCALWAIPLKGERFHMIRVITWSAMAIVAVAYVVLLCSIWADGWLVGYRAWTAASAKYLELACYSGWLLIVCSFGWAARAIYERYFKPAPNGEASGN